MKRPAAPSIGIVGGTGAEGRGLATRWAAAGHVVVIGSRDERRARIVAAQVAERLSELPGSKPPVGGTNLEAAQAGIVVLAVPYAGQSDMLSSIRRAVQGKTLITVVVPLSPPNVSAVRLPAAGSAAVEAQSFLGTAVNVVAAFQNVAAGRLEDMSADIACDVLVCGDDAAAKRDVLRLVADIGAAGFDAGPLANAVVPEGLTPVLIGINKRYGSRHAGLRITNVPRDSADPPACPT